MPKQRSAPRALDAARGAPRTAPNPHGEDDGARGDAACAAAPCEDWHQHMLRTLTSIDRWTLLISNCNL